MITVKNKYTSKRESNDIYIGRGSPLGNPYCHLEIENSKAEFKCDTREEAVKKFENYITDKIEKKDPLICAELNKIYSLAKKQDVNLVCFCKPKNCHGDIIKKIIEKQLYKINKLI